MEQRLGQRRVQRRDLFKNIWFVCSSVRRTLDRVPRGPSPLRPRPLPCSEIFTGSERGPQKERPGKTSSLACSRTSPSLRPDTDSDRPPSCCVDEGVRRVRPLGDPRPSPVASRPVAPTGTPRWKSGNRSSYLYQNGRERREPTPTTQTSTTPLKGCLPPPPPSVARPEGD